MEPTCLSGGWHQPPLPGIPRRRMCNPVHHFESHVIVMYSEGLPAEVANHLTSTASIAARLCTISTFLMLSEVIGSKPWRHTPGGVGPMTETLAF